MTLPLAAADRLTEENALSEIGKKLSAEDRGMIGHVLNNALCVVTANMGIVEARAENDELADIREGLDRVATAIRALTLPSRR